MDVDHALREAGEERRVEQLHVAGEHDELDAARPRASRRSRRRAPRAVGAGAKARASGRRPARARSSARGVGLVGADRDDLDAVAAVDAVEDGLEVGARAGGEDADPHAASSFG